MIWILLFTVFSDTGNTKDTRPLGHYLIFMVLYPLPMVSKSIYITPYHTVIQKVKGSNFISVAFCLVWATVEEQTSCNFVFRKAKVKTAERCLLPLLKWVDLHQHTSCRVIHKNKRQWGVVQQQQAQRILQGWSSIW